MILWGSIVIGWFICTVIVNLMQATNGNHIKEWRRYDDDTQKQSQIGFILIDKDRSGARTYSFFPVPLFRNLKESDSYFTCFVSGLGGPVYLMIFAIFITGVTSYEFVTNLASKQKSKFDFLKLRLFTKQQKNDE